MRALKRKNFSIFLVIFLITQNLFALTVTEDFSSGYYFDSANSTGVWNLSQRAIHPPIVIDPTYAAGVNENTPVLDAGDGSDGSFDTSTYARFSEGGSTAGNIITINTNTYPTLNFTNFNLAAGWTLRGKGTNALWIKVQGSFVNAGVITCSGDNGDSINTNVNTQPQGGVGRCGGGSGGAGGYITGYSVVGTNAPSGSSGCTIAACPAVAGGFGGQTQTTNSGGGGGGGGFYSATAGTSGTGTGPGAGGGSVLDPTMTYIGSAAGGPGAGSGGGGGGYSTTTGASSGAGGGAGGGVIRLTIVGDFTNSGSILSNGGAGGSWGNAADRAGAGGGGAGGTIWILAAGNFNNTGGTITALGGAAGTGTGGGGNGGAGASGRTWISYGKNFSGASENPIANMADNGLIRFSEQSYVVQSKAYDTRNTKPVFTSFSVNGYFPSTSTVTLYVAGSNDNFVSDNTGWILSTGSLSALSGKRFFKFKVNIQYVSSPAITTVPIVTPLQITSIVANYDGNKMAEFNFTPSCGNFGSPWEFLFEMLFCYLCSLFLKRKYLPAQS